MDDHPIKHGHLFSPPQGKLLKRAWQKKYYALYRASNYAIERVEVFDSEEAFHQSSSRKIIPLNDCIKVVQAPQKNQQNVFEVRTKSQVCQFSTETTQELAEWVLAFQKVAFGGQRRDLNLANPPLPSLPSILNTFGGSTSHVRASVVSNTEEENQIYSSFSEPEGYLVQIVETKASVACGLKGGYLLVLSPLQLFLLEETANVNDKKYLFTWPYRHIRRYGRSKDTFTFEAGRKCVSGEGTFTFATLKANDIFVNVQANTRTLKKEVEDAAQSSTGRSICSWPSMDETHPVFAEAQRHHSALVEGDHSSSAKLTRHDSKESLSILDRVLSRNKALPPFAKPPRKSKLGSTGGGASDPNTSPTSEPIRLEISSAARAKLTETSSGGTSSSSSSSPTMSTRPPAEPTYAEPEFRVEAWKTFGMETDNIHVEKTPDSPDYTEGFYASVAVSSSSSKGPPIQWPPKKDVPKILTPPAKKTATDGGSCYDHLSQFSQPPNKSPNPSVSPNGHIYSRLMSNSSSSESAQPSSLQSDTSSCGSEQCTDSVVINNNNNSSGTVENSKSPNSEDIKRFFQNEDVYTVVAKPAKKLNQNASELI